MPPRSESLKKKSPQPQTVGRLKDSPKEALLQSASEALAEAAVKHTPWDATASQAEVVLHEWGYRPKCRGWLYQSVCSPYWRLYYNSKKGHSIQLSDGMLGLGPEHLVLIPPHCIFDCRGVSPVPHFWIHFSYPKHPVHSPPKPVVLPPLEAELSLIRTLQSLRIETPSFSPTEKDLLLGMALIHAVLSRDELSWRAALPAPLLKTLEFIERNFTSELNSNDLAKIAGLSVSGLYRIFQMHLHTSPGNHVLGLKIQKAIHLLKETDMSIEQIADATGFHDRFHLTKIFKKMTGKTPPQFRKEHTLRYSKTNHLAPNPTPSLRVESARRRRLPR